MSKFLNEPYSSLFFPIPIKSETRIGDLPALQVSKAMVDVLEKAPIGDFVAWGILFKIRNVIVLFDQAVSLDLEPFKAKWLVFLHTSDIREVEVNKSGFFSPMRGEGQLGVQAANYAICYTDGSEVNIPIRHRFQIGTFQRIWGENCFEAVAHHKPRSVRAAHEQLTKNWGWTQTRVDVADSDPWTNWLYAWENPYPDLDIVRIRLKPQSGTVILSGISAGSVSSSPLRWNSRRKAILKLPDGIQLDPTLDDSGQLQQIKLDLGQVISAFPRSIYPNDRWSESYNTRLPSQSEDEILVEYTAHPDAYYHLSGDQVIPVSSVISNNVPDKLIPVVTANKRVTLRVAEHESRKVVPVKLHVHGACGEYLAPLDRHRIPNSAWFEDYSVDIIHGGTWDGDTLNSHFCTYIPGETRVDLPLGKVYIEVSKGFEIRPVRKVVEVTPETDTIIIEIERDLPWRARGWVTADTHVHFLSPMTAMLEGCAEGVNVINLLASQWGELMTNVGDFDGCTTWGSREAGGDGEYLVRVGTENRQHVLGHISLLGYGGEIIAPMTTGGPNESALGDPIEVLLTEWARLCKQQGGLVVLPHFPEPRAEHAASVVSGNIDAVEMTSWGNLYAGISPYSLSDWYRYLNCGYLVAAVGGTDKMSANTAVGTVRTYAKIPHDQPFTYEAWMGAVRKAETFVTYGPLMEFSVEGRPMGGQIDLPATGGTVAIEWQLASVTVPMSRVELIVNGEIRESQPISPEEDRGEWSFRVDQSSWMALLVRGHYSDKPVIIAAHSSPVMIRVEGSPMLSAADAITILEQIEGAQAYLNTVGTRANERAYRRMNMVLQTAHRNLHNHMHQLGYFHNHTLMDDHPEHH